jgi:hypothetical protein
MPYATLEEINQHLPATSLQITDAEDDPWQLDAERIIRGFLSNVYSGSTIAGWTTPGSTPALIQSIAGRLIAGWFYASKIAGETTDYPEYARRLYDEALELLNQIRSGDIRLSDVSETPTTGDTITSADFWPNDLEDVTFRMDMEFA